MDVIRKTTGMLKIGWSVELLEELRVEHTDNEVVGLIVIRDKSEDGTRLFTKFSEIMGYGEELLITRTYRNSQEVIDVAGNFIQKNTSQIKKHLESPKVSTQVKS